jgi:hypothetical protein
MLEISMINVIIPVLCILHSSNYTNIAAIGIYICSKKAVLKRFALAGLSVDGIFHYSAAVGRSYGDLAATLHGTNS